MTLRTAAVVATITALALAPLAGCGRTDQQGSGTPAPTSISDGPAKGTVTVWALGEEGELLPKLAKKFEAENPGARIKVTAIPWDASYNKLQAAIAAGTVPDVAQVPGLPAFKDAYAPVPKEIDTSGMPEAARQIATMDGRLTQVPWYVDVRALYYRKDLAKKAGWNEPPKTWPELKRLAADLRDKAGAKSGIRLPASGGGAFLFSLWAPWSAGAEIMNKDQTAWTLDTPQMIEGYTYYTSFFTEGLADPNANPDPGAAANDFVTGRTPMLIDGPHFMQQLKDVGGADFTAKYATAVLPKHRSSASFVGGSNLAVFKKARNSDAAWKFVRWLARPETQLEWYKMSGVLPSVSAAWKDPVLAGDPKVAVFGRQLETGKTVPQLVALDQIATVANGTVESMVRGKASPADALAKLQRKAREIGVR